MTAPLSDLVVVEISGDVATRYCGKLFAEHGARVIGAYQPDNGRIDYGVRYSKDDNAFLRLEDFARAQRFADRCVSLPARRERSARQVNPLLRDVLSSMSRDRYRVRLTVTKRTVITSATMVLAAGFCVLFIGGGARFAIGLTLKSVVEEFGWSGPLAMIAQAIAGEDAANRG